MRERQTDRQRQRETDRDRDRDKETGVSDVPIIERNTRCGLMVTIILKQAKAEWV